MKLSFITNTPPTEQSGGGSGVNNATIQQLRNYFDVCVCNPINPGYDHISKIKSAFLRKIGLKRNYHFFSEHRLKTIAKEFNSISNQKESNAFFYHGFTPWIKAMPDKPYFCFNDACFATYVDIYNNKEGFNQTDLERIYQQEASWLSKAAAVFFRSQWALEETKEHYQLCGDNFYNVGVGGFIEIPGKYDYNGNYNFLFISREFIPKGGLVVSAAIKKVRKKHPTANLWIVGEKPPQEIIHQEGIKYKGFFDKSITNEKQQLNDIFRNAFALVHPTLKDTNTLVINELAYFGCPAIASNRFAIPEYLLDGKTGYLLDDPKDVDELADLMCKLIEDEEKYRLMRLATRENAIQNNTWDKVGERIATVIKDSLSQ
ncbi:glycosyltransferase family 4 protein [Carboxylicivirga marina]|uniref:glycosyltransferase family 4 protein n=1 Tax=Carboxylicivirga marina TaxID=2800988 RepID=UPI002598C871|nr:glycosyltransferase family 4 protein [uncultured Carboxylicivirga sp.]